jgi:enoyl-CoA hydratase/carnithine racemase
MRYIAELETDQAHVALLEIRRGPFNYVNENLLRELADTLERLDADPLHQCCVLAADGSAFSAGADFNNDDGTDRDPGALYKQAMRLFRTTKPVVAAVHGAAVGAGLGLAVAADFRVTCAQARFSANFNRLGFHPGFGLSVTLPRLIGAQQASMLFYTGKRIGGEEAVRIGLADALVQAEEVRSSALKMAGQIALSAPLAVESTRATLRTGWADEVASANRYERELQKVQFATQDFREGVRAMAERRDPVFARR